VRRWIKYDAKADGTTSTFQEIGASMAGFPTYGRIFYLARAALNPPNSLCKKLFPAIGE
jgi:hypothetical protein